MSILVVNSSPTESQDIERVLRDGGFREIRITETIDGAYELLGVTGRIAGIPGLDVELVILDMTQEFEGAQACRKIKEVYHYSDMPIIVVSDSVHQEAMQLAFAFGASDYISKPLREFELLARVRSAFRLKHEVDRRKARERELLEVTRQLADVNSVLTRLSYIDSLTGTANRRCFDNSLAQEWRRAARNDRPLSLLMIDIDFFKLFNDNYGHQAGDECLRAVATGLKMAIRRPGDLLARFGGEEFAVILPETPLEGAVNVAETLRSNVEDLKLAHKHSSASPFVTVSVGASSILPKRNTPTSFLVQAADEALYEAKSAGRNCIRHRDLTRDSVQKSS